MSECLLDYSFPVGNDVTDIEGEVSVGLCRFGIT